MRRAAMSIALAVFLAATMGAAWGCGGSDGGATTGASQADFVAQANAICRSANEEFVALGDMQQFDDLADFRDRFPKAIAIAREQYADISRLTPPDDISVDVAAYLQQGDLSVALSEDLYDQVMAGKDLPEAEGATIGSDEGQEIIAERRRAATAAGLEDCAS
ncbi:MAG: hypothetical protein O3B97_02305 [Actinomycetota bacterium]|nr:hypothetical protein [Actinomycetota bacterium]